MKQENLIRIIVFSALIFGVFTTFNIAYAVDNNCGVSIWSIYQLPPVLGCIDDRLDILENAPAGSESTECINMASQYQLVVNSTDGNCFIRALANGTGITMTTNNTHIVINSTASGGESTVCSNLGSVGEGIVASSSGGDCDFKKLLAGTGISLSSNGTRITITNTLPESTVCGNLGTGNPLHDEDSNCDAFSLIAGDGITITDTTDDWTIAITRIGQMVAQMQFSITKTNIGTTYNTIYNAGDGQIWEHLTLFDTTNAKDMRILFVWDYVGIGTQQCRFNDSVLGVLYESTTFIVDQNPYDSGWVDIPTGFENEINTSIDWQCKSTTGTDDPIGKGYVIFVR